MVDGHDAVTETAHHTAHIAEPIHDDHEFLAQAHYDVSAPVHYDVAPAHYDVAAA